MTSNRPNRPAGRHRSGVGHCLGLSLVAAALLAAAPVQAKTIRIADQGDALSMDPHSLNESAQLSFLQNVYEPLVARDRKLGVVPGAGNCLDAAVGHGVDLQDPRRRDLP